MQTARPRPMGIDFPLGDDPAAIRRRIETIEWFTERSFTIPGIKTPVGFDAIVGIIPFVGDAIGAVVALYLVWEARKLGMSKFKLGRMLANVGIDSLLGAIPLAGDVFDVMFRANTRNLRIVLRHLDKHYPHTRIIDA